MRPLSDISLLPGQCDADSVLAEWSWRVPENYHPILLSLFGDWFFLDSAGRVHILDITSSELNEIAASETEFFAMLETEEQRCEWLRAHVVEAAEKAGIQRSASQCFCLSHTTDDGWKVGGLKHLAVGFREVPNRHQQGFAAAR